MSDEYKLILFACGVVALTVFWIAVNARRHVTGRRHRDKPKFNEVHIGRI